MLRKILFLATLSTAAAFAPLLPAAGGRATTGLQLRMAGQKMGSVSSLPAGERKIEGDVMVVNHKDTIYALSPKCPHLGLPMKTGEITDGPGGPCITCKFHNSKFKLETGEATQWTTGVMGIENAMIGNIMGKVGGAANSPATVYAVSVEEGDIIVDTAQKGKSGAPASA